MGFIKMASGLKRFVGPFKQNIDNKYAMLRYQAAHRDFYIEEEKNNGKRFNIIVPTIEASEVFGGVTTALNLFFDVVNKLECDARIITLSPYKEVCNIIPNDYTERGAGKTISLLGIEDSSILLRPNDSFIVTYWTTALAADKMLKYQRNKYGKELRLFYLIQDYEPGFFPWSSDFAECERTYHFDYKMVAIFNSRELRDYFTQQNYSFDKMLYFNPCLNKNLKNYLINSKGKELKREKRIIIYGRPQEYRNAYTLLIDSLDKFSKLLSYEEASRWEIWSLGYKCKNVSLHNGMTVVSKGKMPLEEYAYTMLTSYAAISLMVSPHPSYPPLEMATFGVKTITNCFANKDMSYFSQNLYCLKNYDADSISKKMLEIIGEYNQQTQIDYNSEYINTESNMNEIVEYMVKQLKE